MENGDDRNLGQEIYDIVQNAVGSMDFDKLNMQISSTVDSAIETVRKNLDNAVSKEAGSQQTAKKESTKREKNYRIIRDEFGRFEKVWIDSEIRKKTVVQRQSAQQDCRKKEQHQNQPVPQPQHKKVQPLVAANPAGRISGVIYKILGGTFTFIFGISLFALVATGFWLWEPEALLAAGIIFPFFAGSAALLCNGIVKSRRVRRFYQYVRVLNGRSYAMLEEFSSAAGKSISYVRKDVQKMISNRMFPYGRLDYEGKCLILNNETWQQYCLLKEQVRQQEIEEKEQKRIAQEDPFQYEVNQMLKEGEGYLSEIRRANDAIPGEEISEKLDELELIIRKIFGQIKKHPEKIPEMNKFMDYYLPTTLKLVKVYREFDEQAVAGDNISNGKQEIEDTIGTINKAFLKLFDSLFADTALDISTDISVLQTVLAQEGLTDSDFK